MRPLVIAGLGCLSAVFVLIVGGTFHGYRRGRTDAGEMVAVVFVAVVCFLVLGCWGLWWLGLLPGAELPAEGTVTR
jgi:hypothetical protein